MASQGKALEEESIELKRQAAAKLGQASAKLADAQNLADAIARLS